MKFLFPPLFVALLLAAGPAMAAPAPALFDLTGDWRGTGAIREAPDAPAREGRCRFSAIPLRPGEEIRLKGRCATQAGSAELSMRFVLLDGGVLAAGVATSLREGSVQFDGRLDGAVARLQSREPITLDDVTGISHVTVRVEDAAHFTLRQWFAPADGSEPVVLVDMRFQR
ncbi:MAG TPA: hypothetical protein ENJ52_07870 [Aliiroseovarius sp.]|nr:hypothetical protein [Aliiroseovarius sp.]